MREAQLLDIKPDIKEILNSIRAAVIIVNSNYEIVLVNHHASNLFKSDKLIGMSIKNLFPIEDRDILLPNILNLTREKKEFETQAMLKRTDNSTFIALISTSICRWDDSLIVFLIYDISGEKELERFLRQSERMAFLGRMLDDISHQIRNPVLSIGGFARRLLKVDGCKKEYVNVILESSSRLELLLSTLRSFISLPKANLEFTSVSKLLEQIESPLKEVANSMNGELNIKVIPDSNWSVLVDPLLFKKAIVDIVKNGFEAYMPSKEPKIVNFTLISSSDSIRTFIIEDFGTGINPKYESMIFDPFFTTKTGHIGMGLTFAKRIIEEQEGSIYIESKLGQGTKALITLKSDRRRLIRRKLVNKKDC